MFVLQDKVVNSTSELYSFMDSADATLALKVLGEVDENGEPIGQHGEEGGHAGTMCTKSTLDKQKCPASWHAVFTLQRRSDIPDMKFTVWVQDHCLGAR